MGIGLDERQRILLLRQTPEHLRNLSEKAEMRALLGGRTGQDARLIGIEEENKSRREAEDIRDNRLKRRKRRS